MLLADDDVVVLEIIQKLLVSAGYRVTAVRGGAAAFRAFVHDRPDAVVADLNMAAGDGYVLISRIREEASTPVLVISGCEPAYAQQRIKRECQGVAFLAKPFLRQRFLDEVEHVLRGDIQIEGRSPKGEMVG